MSWIYDKINNQYVFKEGVPKFQNSGKLPIGNQKQYDYVVGLYKSFIDNGATPQSALDFTNLVVAEGGWYNYKTGDGRQFRNSDELAKHVLGHHRRMFPETLRSKDWNSFYRGLNVTPKYKYNSENPNYKNWLYQSRPGVRKRVNHFRKLQNQPPLAYINEQEETEIS